MKPHHLPPTTHTIEMAQIAEFNTRLEAHQGPALTAAELGLEGAPLHRRSTGVLPGTAELIRVAWDGAPEFPDIHAHFDPTAAPGTSDVVVVDLHTAALRLLSHRLGMHHGWGVGDV